jgi:hypothetical protein
VKKLKLNRTGRRWIRATVLPENCKTADGSLEMSARQQQQTPPDELERYRQMPFMSTAEWETRYGSKALLWWAETGRIMFPRLAMMTKEYYSTQRKSS